VSDFTTVKIRVATQRVRTVDGCWECPLHDGEFNTCQAIDEDCEGDIHLEDEDGCPTGDTLPDNCPLRSGPVIVQVTGDIPPCHEEDL